MLRGYRAVLKGDRLEWTEAPPPEAGNGGVPVVVIVLEEAGSAVLSQGEQMAAALARLAEAGGITSFGDPVAWQRGIREDRPLYGRDES